MEEKERYVIDYYDDIIFDTEKGYYPSGDTICKALNQQDKRIKELEEEKKELEIKLDKCGTELVNAESLVSNLEEVQFDYKKENQQLKQQLERTEKALELAEETIKQMCGKPLWIGGNIPSPEPKDGKYFKDIAKEMLENE